MQVEVAGHHFELRPMAQDEEPLVMDSWVSTASQLYRRSVHKAAVEASFEKMARDLMHVKGVHVLERNDTVHAWACGEPPNVLHFAYVSFKLRGHGMGRRVIESVLEGYPSLVWVTSAPLAFPWHKRFMYNPFLLRS